MCCNRAYFASPCSLTYFFGTCARLLEHVSVRPIPQLQRATFSAGNTSSDCAADIRRKNLKLCLALLTTRRQRRCHVGRD